MNTKLILHIAFACLALLSSFTLAQQSQHFGPFELHYSVVNTTFLDPKVAATYGITRGKQHAILNLAVRQHSGDTSTARSMLLQGHSRDLTQRSEVLDFKEIREGDAIYYIAEFKFINEEWRFFEVDFRPEGADQTFSFTFKHQLYVN